jgi:hypothetical protein
MAHRAFEPLSVLRNRRMSPPTLVAVSRLLDAAGKITAFARGSIHQRRIRYAIPITNTAAAIYGRGT